MGLTTMAYINRETAKRLATEAADEQRKAHEAVLAEAFKAGFEWCANGTDKHGEYNGGSIADGFAEWLAKP
jgi:hypothetical protein